MRKPNSRSPMSNIITLLAVFVCLASIFVVIMMLGLTYKFYNDLTADPNEVDIETLDFTQETDDN